MRFLDEVIIHVTSGGGGHGSLSFRRESCLPKGGPDGGNGGRGGHIILQATSSLNTLIDFRYRSHVRARRGGGGAGKNRTGENALDLIVDVPLGCVICTEDGTIVLADLNQEGKQYKICRGGKGGHGNAHFKSSIKQAPRFAERGEEGEERSIRLRLKVIADVGIIGCPNVGKSTFLSSITRAQAETGDYPFTTLYVGLGVYETEDGVDRIIFADIPGLVEGAHLGVGLGARFLGHSERCSLLLCLLDASHDDPIKQGRILREELQSYGAHVSEKPMIWALNKCDICSRERIKELQTALQELSGQQQIFAISSLKGEWDGLLSSLTAAWREMKDAGGTVSQESSSSWHPLDGYQMNG